MTERIRRLRELFLNTKKSICIERARIVTRAYQELTQEPVILKRAKVLDRILSEMTIYIKEDELIVGHNASRTGGLPVVPEVQANWIGKQLDDFATRKIFPVEISDEDKEELRALLPFWKGRTVEDKGLVNIPEETQRVFEMSPAVITLGSHLRGTSGHITVNYEKVLKKGFNGICEEAREKKRQLDLTDPFVKEKLDFYEAVEIVCQAACKFAGRYSVLLGKMAEECEDPARKKELAMMSRICERVPAYPASSFYEAVQSFWFTHVIIMIETEGPSTSPGRMDQYLYPYCKMDQEAGIWDEEFAQELLDNLFIRFNEVDRVPNVPVNASTYVNANSMSEMVIVGGQDKRGNDATNLLTYMFFTAQKHTGFPMPALGARLHSKTPRRLLLEIVSLAKTSCGKPSMFNDEVIIESLLKDGVTLEDARDYGVIGCVEPAPSGNSFTWCNAAMMNLAKCLELALFNGTDPVSGKKVNDITFIDEASSFEEIVAAYEKQVEYYVFHMTVMLNNLDKIQAENMPIPYVSSIMDDCVEKGMDITLGGAKYNYVGPQGIGLADVTDSLLAIRQAVFKERRYTLEDIKTAMKENHKDERMHQYLLNMCEKFGNDDPEVDAFARRIGRHYCLLFKDLKNRRGGGYRPGLYSVAGHVALGNAAGALPDGKKRNQSLAHGVSPVYGSARKGLSAIFNSVGRLDLAMSPNGTSLNPNIHPTLLRTKEDEEKMADVLRKFVDQKIMHLCFNVVTEETLRDAQAHPEKYRSLVVRISGYCAFFTELSYDIQMDVIRRCGVYQ